MIRPLPRLAVAVATLLLAACASAPRGALDDGEGRALRPFRDEAELAEFHAALQRRRLEIQRREEAERGRETGGGGMGSHLLHPDLPQPNRPVGEPVQYERFLLPPSDAPAHHEGGDARPLVHLQGDRLVMLRRGRLFTARISGDTLQPLAAADAFGPAQPGDGYDEVLVSGDHVVVIGASFRARSTELVLFRMMPDGRLAHRATYQVRSGDDPLRAHTYAARVVDGRLVFYAPLPVDPAEPSTHLPRLYRGEAAGEPTAPASRVYRAAWNEPPPFGMVLHTVMRCGLEDDGVRCESTAVYGWQGRVFHMSSTAVYVWTRQIGDRPAMLHRIPLDGAAPTALQVPNEPVDASAFMESADGHLHVLMHPAGRVNPVSGGTITGPLVLLRVPLADFGDGSRAAHATRYTTLPLRGWGALAHRYLGDWLVYGTNAGPHAMRRGYGAVLYAAPLAGGSVMEVPLPNGVDRIEPMGSGAVLAGTDGTTLHVTGLRVGPGGIALGPTLTVPGDSSYGLFYRPDGPDAGVLAVPFRRPGRSGMGGVLRGADGIRFLRNRDFRLEEIGELAAGEFSGDDGCPTSCQPWFGDTRPLFAGGRIFALIGGELVEGAEADGRIRELRRANLALPSAVREAP